MSKMKIAIIGCGTIANSAHIPAYMANEEVEIKYFCDSFLSNAEKAVKQYGCGIAVKDYHEVRIMGITSNYAGFMHIGMEGQTPQKKDEILVDRTFASKLGGNVIGKTLYDSTNQAFTITGIVDGRTTSKEEIGLLMTKSEKKGETEHEENR